MAANLKLVAKPVAQAPFDDARGKKLMEQTRAKLLAIAVRYVKEGRDGTRGDRVRTASNLSGVPINLIEVAAK